MRGDGDVELAIDMLGSNKQVQTEALAMLLRYKIIDKRFVQLLLWGLSARARRLSSIAH